MKILWSLLVPWEFGMHLFPSLPETLTYFVGRCSFEGNSLNIDVSNVIWLATSNIGHDLVPQFFAERSIVDRSVSRDEYVEVMKRVRPVVSDLIGVSLYTRRIWRPHHFLLSRSPSFLALRPFSPSFLSPERKRRLSGWRRSIRSARTYWTTRPLVNSRRLLTMQLPRKGMWKMQGRYIELCPIVWWTWYNKRNNL